MINDELFIIADLDNTISPTGASDAVVRSCIGVIALIYSSVAN